MRKKLIIYTGAFRFPELDAAATRVLYIGECLRKINYNVEFLSWSDHEPLYYQGKYREFEYTITQDLLSNTKKNKLKSLIDFLFLGKKTLKWLWLNKEKLKKTKAIFLYNTPSFFSFSIFLLSKIYKFKIILDSTEWYESDHLPGGKYGIVSFENHLRMNFTYKLFKNKIAISSYLENHYLKINKKSNVITIPALCDTPNESINFNQKIEKINLIYAGNPGKKDQLDKIIKILPNLNNKISKYQIKLDLYGPNENDIKKIIPSNIYNAAVNYLNIHGKVSKEKILSAYKVASFSILFREEKRYAYAGFPTKAVESWFYGVPVITNAIGDISKYCNKENSILIKNDKDIESILLEIFQKFDINENIKNQKNCLSFARNNFSWDIYTNSIQSFMDNLK